MGKPKVSVLILTYNHEKFIAQAVESVLAQKTKFEFELLIGGDESEDGTREIVKSYAAKYPKVIRLFLRKREDAVVIDGRPTGRSNFIKLYEAARGEYVCELVGDDYWLGRENMQVQADWLDEHPESKACFHAFQVVNEKGELKYEKYLDQEKSRFGLEDLFMGFLLI